jgi:hypothetical protein
MQVKGYSGQDFVVCGLLGIMAGLCAALFVSMLAWGSSLRNTLLHSAHVRVYI